MRQHVLVRFAALAAVGCCVGCGTAPSHYHRDPFSSVQRSRNAPMDFAAATTDRSTVRGPAGTEYVDRGSVKPASLAADEAPIVEPTASIALPNQKQPVAQANYGPAPRDEQTPPTDNRSTPAITRPSGSSKDNAADFSWIRGQLDYSALGGGVWKVRYAPISADDEFGGSVVLNVDPSKKGFGPGDRVEVHGQLVAGDARAGRSPTYNVLQIARAE